MDEDRRPTIDRVYTDFQMLEQPSVYRSFGETFVAQRKQFIILAVIFACGLVVSLTYSPFGGGTLMSGAGVSLIGTMIGGRYY